MASPKNVGGTNPALVQVEALADAMSKAAEVIPVSDVEGVQVDTEGAAKILTTLIKALQPAPFNPPDLGDMNQYIGGRPGEAVKFAHDVHNARETNRIRGISAALQMAGLLDELSGAKSKRAEQVQAAGITRSGNVARENAAFTSKLNLRNQAVITAINHRFQAGEADRKWVRDVGLNAIRYGQQKELAKLQYGYSIGLAAYTQDRQDDRFLTAHNEGIRRYTEAKNESAKRWGYQVLMDRKNMELAEIRANTALVNMGINLSKHDMDKETFELTIKGLRAEAKNKLWAPIRKQADNLLKTYNDIYVEYLAKEDKDLDKLDDSAHAIMANNVLHTMRMAKALQDTQTYERLSGIRLPFDIEGVRFIVSPEDVSAILQARRLNPNVSIQDIKASVIYQGRMQNDGTITPERILKVVESLKDAKMLDSGKTPYDTNLGAFAE